MHHPFVCKGIIFMDWIVNTIMMVTTFYSLHVIISLMNMALAACGNNIIKTTIKQLSNAI